MPRPSLKEERAQEILDAFERCVVRFGVEGATLQAVADEAGLARSLLRHHVGNRDEMLEALAARFFERTDARTRQALESLEPDLPVRSLLEILFGADFGASSRDILLFQALSVAAQDRPDLKERVRGWYLDFENMITQVFRRNYPDSPPERVDAVALAVFSMYVNSDSMAPLVADRGVQDRSFRAALSLLDTL